jgi:hypothetical protein
VNRTTGFKWYSRSLIEGDQCIFPERFPPHVIDEIRKREGPYKFAAQYLNNPIAQEGADYKPEWLRYYSVAQDNRTLIPRDNTPPVRLASLLRFSFYDPSSGGKTARAENAILGVGSAPDKRLFVLHAWSANCSIGEAIEQWHRLNDRFTFYKCMYESVGAQKTVNDLILTRDYSAPCKACKALHKRIRPEPVTPGPGNKEDRIRMFSQSAFEDGRVYLRVNQEKLKTQILSFPHGEMVDQFDALAYLCKFSRAPISEDEIRDEKEAAEQRKQMVHQRISSEWCYGGYI